MGIAHFEQAPAWDASLGHLQARWTDLGTAAGCAGVGVRRIEVAAGAWSTPAHDHAGAEELFYVLGGSGISWHDGATAEIGAGDAIACRAGAGAHTLHALEPLDVLAFGPRHRDGSTRFPRLGMTIGAGGAITVDSDPRAELRELLLKARAPLEAVGLALHGRRDGARFAAAAPRLRRAEPEAPVAGAAGQPA